MKTFKEYCLLEMARPASSFADLDMNQAYAESLKKFKGLGIDNVNTYIIWDFMFRQLPEFFHRPQFIEAKKKASGGQQRNFVLSLVKAHPDKVDFVQWGRAINDMSNIRAFIDREDRGNRHVGRVRADAQQVINNLSRPQSSGLA